MSREAFEIPRNPNNLTVRLATEQRTFDLHPVDLASGPAADGYKDTGMTIWEAHAALSQQAGEVLGYVSKECIESVEFGGISGEFSIVGNPSRFFPNPVYTSPQPAVPEGFVPLGYKRKTGEWVYLNHAGEWHLCPSPCPQVPEPQR